MQSYIRIYLIFFSLLANNAYFLYNFFNSSNRFIYERIDITFN